MAQTINIHEMNTRWLDERINRFDKERFVKIKNKTFCRIRVSKHAYERSIERIGEKDLTQVIKAMILRKSKGQFVVYKAKNKEYYYTRGTINNKKIWVCGTWDLNTFVITTIIPRVKGQMKDIR